MTRPVHVRNSSKKLRFLTSRRALALSVALTLLVAGLGTLFTYRHEAYRQVALQRVADQAAGVGNDEQRALNLLDEILRIGNLDPGSAVIDDDPAGTLIRGWGYCDSIAMAFVQVAERMGFQGQLVFLQNPDTGTSPHTLATLKLGDEWRVFDVLYRGVSRNTDGALATLKDIASTRAPVTSPKVQAAWFANPTIFYQSRPPNTLRDHARSAARWAVSLMPSWTMRAAQDVYVRTGPPVYVENNGKVWEDWQEASDLDYWKARNYDVFGRSEPAQEMYRRVLEDDPTSPHAAPSQTFLRQATDPGSIPTYTTQTGPEAKG